MNELILKKVRELDEKNSISAGLSTMLVSTAETGLTYTPVTQETFEKWCIGYMEKLQKFKEESKTEKDLKPSGREIFESKSKIGNLVLEVEEDDEEFGEEGDDDDEEEDVVFYDKALYALEEGINDDEEVDFD